MTAKKSPAIAKIADAQTTFAELKDVRTIQKTGNFVLVFDHAEVIMPGGWRLNRDLYIGDEIVAYWDEDAEGNRRFHLDWADTEEA